MSKDKKINFYGNLFFECEMCESHFTICGAYVEIVKSCLCGLCENLEAEEFLNKNNLNNILDYSYEEY